MKTKAKIETVIVGVDFSRFSKATVKQGRAVAKHLKVPLVLAVAKTFPNLMIVVGNRGIRGAVSRYFLGSTAERLALNSPYPVLVHKGRKVVLPKKILIPCDFSARSKNTIEGSKRLGLKGTTFELYHVLQPPVPVLDYQGWQFLYDEINKNNALELKRFQKQYGPLKVVEAKSADVTGRIEKHGKSFDLIAISPREHKGMFPSFGSITSKVVRTGDTSVLVIP